MGIVEEILKQNRCMITGLIGELARTTEGFDHRSYRPIGLADKFIDRHVASEGLLDELAGQVRITTDQCVKQPLNQIFVDHKPALPQSAGPCYPQRP